MKSKVIAGILSLLNDECGRLNGDWEANKDDLRTVLCAYDAVGRIRAEDVDHERLNRNNNHGRSFAEHPDRCECQGNDPGPHRHYEQAPYHCARCECEAYAPVAETLKSADTSGNGQRLRRELEVAVTRRMMQSAGVGKMTDEELMGIRQRDMTELTHDSPESIAQCKADRHALLIALDWLLVRLKKR